MSSAMRFGWTRLAPPLALFGAVLAVWHAGVVLFDLPPYLLPTPGEVLRAAWSKGPTLLAAMLITGSAAIVGFGMSLAIGVTVAVLFSQSTALRRSGYPYAIFLQTVPIVAIAPLITLWFGAGFWGVAIVAHIISLFPIISTTTAGLLAVPAPLLELFRLNRASRWRRLWKLQFPYAVPHLMTGAKTSAGLAVVGAIVGEFFAGYGAKRQGLGYLILQAIPQLKTAELFAEVAASALLGVIIFAAVSLVSDQLLARWTRAD